MDQRKRCPSLSDASFWTAERLAQLERICAFQWPKKKFATLLKHFAASESTYWNGIPDNAVFWFGVGERGERDFLEALHHAGHSVNWALEQLTEMKEAFTTIGLKPSNMTLRSYAVRRNFHSTALFVRGYLYPDNVAAHIGGNYITGGLGQIMKGIHEHSRTVIASAASTHAKAKIWLSAEPLGEQP